MKVFFRKLQLDQNSVLQELFKDLLANIVLKLTLSYQTSDFYYRDIANHNPQMTLLLGDYNARNTKWYYHDITTTKGTQPETTTTVLWTPTIN